jgi:hypothetical protein
MRRARVVQRSFAVSKIAISQAAFEAIARTLPFGSTGYENKIDEKSQSPDLVTSRRSRRLNHLRGAGETFSDVILRLASEVASS